MNIMVICTVVGKTDQTRPLPRLPYDVNDNWRPNLAAHPSRLGLAHRLRAALSLTLAVIKHRVALHVTLVVAPVVSH